MTMPERPPTTPDDEPTAGAPEVLALVGLALLVAGVALSLGVGPALAVAGGMLLVVAVLLAISRARAGRT